MATTVTQNNWALNRVVVVEATVVTIMIDDLFRTVLIVLFLKRALLQAAPPSCTYCHY